MARKIRIHKFLSQPIDILSCYLCEGKVAHLLDGFWGSCSALFGEKYWDTESDIVPYTRLAPSCAKPMTRPNGLEGTLRSLSFLRTSSFFCAMPAACSGRAIPHRLPLFPNAVRACAYAADAHTGPAFQWQVTSRRCVLASRYESGFCAARSKHTADI